MNVFEQAYAGIVERAAAYRAKYGEVSDSEAAYLAAQSPRCSTCHDSGFVVVELGKLPEPCTACDIVAGRRRERFAKLGPVPAPYDAYTFADFPATSPLMANACRKMAALGDSPPRHLFLWGPVGSGKTSLGTCVYRAWLANGAAGMWFSVPGLLNAIRAGFDRETRSYLPNELVDAVCTVPVLLLDDIGAERVTDWVAAQLYEVVNRRQERPTIFTSNLDLAALCDRLGGIDGERIVSRIQGMAEPHIYHVDGPDLRQKKNRGAA